MNVPEYNKVSDHEKLFEMITLMFEIEHNCLFLYCTVL